MTEVALLRYDLRPPHILTTRTTVRPHGDLLQSPSFAINQQLLCIVQRNQIPRISVPQQQNMLRISDTPRWVIMRECHNSAINWITKLVTQPNLPRKSASPRQLNCGLEARKHYLNVDLQVGKQDYLTDTARQLITDAKWGTKIPEQSTVIAPTRKQPSEGWGNLRAHWHGTANRQIRSVSNSHPILETSQPRRRLCSSACSPDGDDPLL